MIPLNEVARIGEGPVVVTSLTAKFMDDPVKSNPVMEMFWLELLVQPAAFVKV